MRYPNTIDKNIYLAYIRKENCQQKSLQCLDAINLNWDLNYPESLVELCIKVIAENWGIYPIFSSITVCENRALLSDIMNFSNLQLSDLSAHIRIDSLWKRMYETKWSLNSNIENRPWIELYIERFLAESIENFKPSEYNCEKVKALIELCTSFVRNLTIDHLEVSHLGDNDSINDHIPFDVILEHLNELKSLSISYDVKTIGTQFYLSCTNISDNDLKKFARGLSHTDLEEFKFHNSKLEPSMLKEIGRALEKNAALVTIEMQNCRFGDAGLKNFCSILTHDSLPHVKHITLSNNFISSDGAMLLANILRRRRKIETLDLKLNPIMTEGANEILSIANQIELNKLNLSSCSFEEQIEETLLFVLKSNKHLQYLNISINKLGEELGVKLISVLKFNSTLKKFDIRNSGISHTTKRTIDRVILENREKFNQIE